MNRKQLIAAVDNMIADNPWVYASPDSVEAIIDCVIAAQGDDDAEFHVRKDAPETSKAIVEKIREGTIQDDVLTLFINLYRAGGVGATDDEVEVALRRSHQSVSSARNTLVKRGYLVDSGYTRPNRYGNMACRWTYTGREIVR